MGPHSRAHARVQDWGAAGVCRKLWQAGGEPFEEVQGLDWSWRSLDGAMPKAPLGGKNTGPNPTERAQSGGKGRLLPEGQGGPVGVGVAGAKRPDLQVGQDTVKSGVLKRPRPTPKRPPGRSLDTGDDYAQVRATRQEFGGTAHRRARGDEAPAIQRPARCRARSWVVARTPSWRTRFGRVLIGWDKPGETSRALLPFACARLAFRASGLFG